MYVYVAHLWCTQSISAAHWINCNGTLGYLHLHSIIPHTVYHSTIHESTSFRIVAHAQCRSQRVIMCEHGGQALCGTCWVCAYGRRSRHMSTSAHVQIHMLTISMQCTCTYRSQKCPFSRQHITPKLCARARACTQAHTSARPHTHARMHTHVRSSIICLAIWWNVERRSIVLMGQDTIRIS